jgi:GntR family transcriptional regulator
MAQNMTFAINTESPIAVYMQIENQVQFAIASGQLKPGDRVPAVREMSEMLKTNPNTIAKAYRDLQVMQLVHTRRGVGVTISDKAPKLCRANVRQLVTSHLTDAVAECTAGGLSKNDILGIVESAITSGCKPYESQC